MSKSVYVFNDLDMFFVCAIERQLSFPAGMNKVYCYFSYYASAITYTSTRTHASSNYLRTANR